jgi:cytochrome b subunit of formate dehydrogenase
MDHFVRFNSRQRIEHLVLTVTFIVLAVDRTG